MKVLLRNLLLTIAFHFNFRESNCSGTHGASLEPSSSSHSPHGYNSPVILRYNGRIIEVSYHIQNGHPVPLNCEVLGQHDGVPTVNKKRHLNFMTRALISDGIKYCVVYETGDGVVLGAKFPPITSNAKYTGDPTDFNPDESTCFMTYKGLDFKVTKVPQEKVPLKIELFPRNKSNPQTTYIRKYHVRNVYAHFGGLYFVMYETNREQYARKIVGADIDIEGPNRPHEIYSK